MKVLPSHKANLQKEANLRRMLRYVYGPGMERVLATVSHPLLPGVITGDPTVDAVTIAACHPGGRAALCRNMIFSSDHFPTRQEALAHVPGMSGVLEDFMAKWLPHSPGIGVVHISEGKGRFTGSWRLDSHLLAANHAASTGRAVQFSKADTRAMQRVEEWIRPELGKKFKITRAKGNGEQARPRGTLIYPHSKGIEALEVGRLTPEQLENYVTAHHLATRRRKDGTLISLTTPGGRKLNIARARTLVAHLGGGNDGLHPKAPPFPGRYAGVADDGATPPLAGRHSPTRVVHVGRRRTNQRDGDQPETLFQRRSRRGRRHEIGLGKRLGVAPLGPRLGGHQSPPLVNQHPAGSLLTRSANAGHSIAQAISTLESINIIEP